MRSLPTVAVDSAAGWSEAPTGLNAPGTVRSADKKMEMRSEVLRNQGPLLRTGCHTLRGGSNPHGLEALRQGRRRGIGRTSGLLIAQ